MSEVFSPAFTPAIEVRLFDELTFFHFVVDVSLTTIKVPSFLSSPGLPAALPRALKARLAICRRLAASAVMAKAAPRSASRCFWEEMEDCMRTEDAFCHMRPRLICRKAQPGKATIL